MIWVNYSSRIRESVTAKRVPGTKANKVAPAVELRAILAANLRRARLEKGLSQAELGSLTDLSRKYLGQIEARDANVSIDVLNLIASHLGTTAVALLTARSQKS
jgi:DNA-binding XRE family transcriptional regulator